MTNTRSRTDPEVNAKAKDQSLKAKATTKDLTTKPRTYHTVLEVPQNHEYGLEDSKTGDNYKPMMISPIRARVSATLI